MEMSKKKFERKMFFLKYFWLVKKTYFLTANNPAQKLCRWKPSTERYMKEKHKVRHSDMDGSIQAKKNINYD